MPTFFGRKYLRGKPGTIEKWIGAFVLALTMAIIAVFMLTGGLFKDFVDAHPALARIRQSFGISDKPLFVADPKNMPQPVAKRPAKVNLTPMSGPAGKAAAPSTVTKKITAQKPGVARFVEVPDSKLIAPTTIERYTDNMYEKIDGKESGFRAFYVVDLKCGQYIDPDTPQTFDVYIYDMAAPANAMGMFASERVDSAATLPIGREGYGSGASVFFWKGQYYINVMGPPGAGEAGLAISKQIAAAIAETIADDGQPFWAEVVLPAKDRLPNSLSYQATSALGYEFLIRMFFAKYEIGGKPMPMYITKAADADAATAMFTKFADATAKYDKIVSKYSLEGGQMFVSESPRPGKPSKFGVSFCKGPYFGGVAQCEDQQLAIERAKELSNKLSATDPGDPAAANVPPPAPSGEHHEEDSEPESEGENG